MGEVWVDGGGDEVGVGTSPIFGANVLFEGDVEEGMECEGVGGSRVEEEEKSSRARWVYAGRQLCFIDYIQEPFFNLASRLEILHSMPRFELKPMTRCLSS